MTPCDALRIAVMTLYLPLVEHVLERGGLCAPPFCKMCLSSCSAERFQLLFHRYGRMWIPFLGFDRRGVKHRIRLGFGPTAFAEPKWTMTYERMFRDCVWPELAVHLNSDVSSIVREFFFAPVSREPRLVRFRAHVERVCALIERDRARSIVVMNSTARRIEIVQNYAANHELLSIPVVCAGRRGTRVFHPRNPKVEQAVANRESFRV